MRVLGGTVSVVIGLGAIAFASPGGATEASTPGMCTHDRLTSGDEIESPRAFVVDDGYLYVADETELDVFGGRERPDIVDEFDVFDAEGRHVGTISDGLGLAVGLVPDGDRVLVYEEDGPDDFDIADEGIFFADQIKLYDRDGTFLRQLDVGDDLDLVWFDNQRIYAVDAGADRNVSSDDRLLIADRDGNPTGSIDGFALQFDFATAHGRIYRRGDDDRGAGLEPVIDIFDADGDFERRVWGYREVWFDRDRILLLREFTGGDTQVDVYTLDGATQLGSTGRVDGFVSLRHRLDGQYVGMVDDGVSTRIEFFELDGTRTGLLVDEFAYGDDEGSPGPVWDVLLSPSRLYVQYLPDPDVPRFSVRVYDLDGDLIRDIETLHGIEDVFLVQPTESFLYLGATAPSSAGPFRFDLSVMTPDGALVRRLVETTEGLGFLQPARRVVSGPRVADSTSVTPDPELVYASDFARVAGEIDVYTPFGDYLETFSTQRSSVAAFNGRAVLIYETDRSTDEVVYTMWRRTDRECDVRTLEPGGRVCFGVVGVPGDAAVVNVTPVGALGRGNGLLVSSDVVDVPVAANVNFGVGSVDPNVAVVPIGSDGEVCFVNSRHVVVDVVADHLGTIAGEAYVPASSSGAPSRRIDTRLSN